MCVHLGFNPRAPCGARQEAYQDIVTYDMFQSTRPVRGATKRLYTIDGDMFVSIHAPRAGRDRHPRSSP